MFPGVLKEDARRQIIIWWLHHVLEAGQSFCSDLADEYEAAVLHSRGDHVRQCLQRSWHFDYRSWLTGSQAAWPQSLPLGDGRVCPGPPISVLVTTQALETSQWEAAYGGARLPRDTIVESATYEQQRWWRRFHSSHQHPPWLACATNSFGRSGMVGLRAQQRALTRHLGSFRAIVL